MQLMGHEIETHLPRWTCHILSPQAFPGIFMKSITSVLLISRNINSYFKLCSKPTIQYSCSICILSTWTALQSYVCSFYFVVLFLYHRRLFQCLGVKYQCFLISRNINTYFKLCSNPDIQYSCTVCILLTWTAL